MFRFVVPLQGPKASSRWERVSTLCNATLNSITAQTNQEFEVVLVCNELPLNFNRHPKVTVVLVDLPAPEPNTNSRMTDKWKKVRTGLASFRGRGDAYYMVVDADDRVNRNLVDFVLKANYHPGWFFDKGLIYDWGFPWVYKKKERFDLLCGTSSVCFCPEDLLPLGADDPATDCYIVTMGHTRIKNYFDGRSAPLKPLPFYGSIYLSHTGENDSGLYYIGVRSRRQQIERILSIKLITNKIREEFALWDI